MSPEPTASPLTFPCRFPIKAFGAAEDGFESLVVSLVQRHVVEPEEPVVTVRPSRGGKYLAVTVTITATSREQLDAIYLDLTGHERVSVAL